VCLQCCSAAKLAPNYQIQTSDPTRQTAGGVTRVSAIASDELARASSEQSVAAPASQPPTDALPRAASLNITNSPSTGGDGTAAHDTTLTASSSNSIYSSVVRSSSKPATLTEPVELADNDPLSSFAKEQEAHEPTMYVHERAAVCDKVTNGH
jgi:hypothetical protein